MNPDEASPASTVLEAKARPSTPYSERRELFIGLVGALGTKLDEVCRILGEELRSYSYDCVPIRLSDLFSEFPEYEALDRDTLSSREYYNRAINAGNLIRQERFHSSGAIAEMGAWHIKRLRTEDSDERRAVAYIIKSLKTPEEVRQLREIYGQLFYCIGIYADEADRLNRLIKELHARSDEEKKKGAREAAQELMDRDKSEGSDWGQNVRGTFTEADYFIRTDDESDLRQAIHRFLKLIFDVPYVGPTRSEIAMMHARAAALRSVDLSRQIGAAIIARDGRLLTTGCNEVPKAGGGQYSVEDTDDRRDFQVGYDTNDAVKREAIEELLERVYDHYQLDVLKDAAKAYLELFNDRAFKDTRIDSLIEFGRIVHAENAAINNSCMETISIRDCDLYCTTFPCHMCTRAIINVGIRNVFYIEPYPKSAAEQLYPDSLVVDPKLSRAQYNDRLTATSVCDRRVHYIAFEGVAPRRYSDLFGYTKSRKDKKTGKVEIFDPITARPRQSPLTPVYIQAEEVIAGNVERLITAAQDDKRSEREATSTTNETATSPASRTSVDVGAGLETDPSAGDGDAGHAAATSDSQGSTDP